MKVGGGRSIIQIPPSYSLPILFGEHHPAPSHFAQCLEKLSVQCFIICLHLRSAYTMLIKCSALEEPSYV